MTARRRAPAAAKPKGRGAAKAKASARKKSAPKKVKTDTSDVDDKTLNAKISAGEAAQATMDMLAEKTEEIARKGENPTGSDGLLMMKVSFNVPGDQYEKFKEGFIKVNMFFFSPRIVAATP